MSQPVAEEPARSDWTRRLRGIRAFILDLDGVVTDTAELHRRAWKQTFDRYLEEREGPESEPFSARDYRRYVDGKPRYDGAESFLDSRGIDLPRGDPDDPPSRATVCGLGNRKNRRYLELLDEEGPGVIEGAVPWIRRARERGCRVGIVTSSRNGERVLETAGIADLFDTLVDGQVGAERGLPGKPDPAYFLAAAGDLGVGPEQAAVVEDSEAGVEAGRRGGFGVVIGVADDDAAARSLRTTGADHVVSALADVPMPEREE